MKNSKILWFNWRCWLNPAMGGAEVFTHEISKRWVETGNDVTLFTSRFRGSKKEEMLDGVKILRYGGRFSIYWNAKKFYKKQLRKESFDIIIDEINTVPFFAPEFAKNGEKVVALIHQLAREYWFYEMPFPISHLGYYFLEDKWLRQYVDTPTVTVSNSTLTDLTDLGFKDVHVIPEGLNFNPLSTISEKELKPTIVFAGRLKRAKRPDHAILALKILRERIPDAQLWILGDGPFRKTLERKAGSNVKFFGHLDNNARRELIKRSWVLVNPSVREGWGLNITEAGALGVPAVAYDVNGLRDSIKNGETGLIAKAGDIIDFAEKIIEVLKDANLRMILSKNALEYSKMFNWEKSADDFLKYIQ